MNRRNLVVAAAAATLLVGCGSEQAGAILTSTAFATVTATLPAEPATTVEVTTVKTTEVKVTTTVTVSPSQTEDEPAGAGATTSTPSAVASGARVTIHCTDEDYEYVDFTDESYQDAWKAEGVDCEYPDVEFADGFKPNAVELKAMKVGYNTTKPDEGLDTLYGICTDPGDPTDLGEDRVYPFSEDQVAELRGALTLCPKHPSAKRLATALAAAEEQLQLVKDHKYAKDGMTYLVGSEIVPGTYQTARTKITSCYWEISDSSGEIMDNNFINGAPQFQVAIPAGAGAFTSDGCGDFVWISE